MRHIHRAAGAFGLLAALACASGEVPEPPADASVTADGTCAAHGVLLAVCTKHNPALIPVFQAKGDWCPEHGFPLSFCPIHHPERGGKPAIGLSDDGSPADGTKIRFRTRDAATLAGIVAVPARVSTEEGGVEAVARLNWDATRHAVVGAQGAGVITRVVADVGARVEAGDALAVVRSGTAGADRKSADAARIRLDAAEQALARKRGLAGAVSQAELSRAEQEVAGARADVAARDAGVGFTVTTPIAGVVLTRDITVGAAVDAGDRLFEVVDPSTLWAELDVPERDALLVRVGQPASVRFEGLEAAAVGVIAYVSPAIDERSRTILARVPLPNPDGALRANLYGTARVAVGGGRAVVVVPRAAVQRAKSVDLVFVRIAEDTWEARRVSVVRRQGEDAHVTGNVRDGDPVASEGSFLLKTETLKDSIGAGCCDVE